MSGLRRDPAKALEWQQRSRAKARENRTRRTPMRRVSKKQRVANREYSRARREFLTANPLCARCSQVATEIHHRKGREGALLVDTRYFLSVCRACHDFIENNPQEAFAQGFKVSRHKTNE